MLLRQDWLFALLPSDTPYADVKEADFVPVSVPHDWQISRINGNADGDGWYRRTIEIRQQDLSGRIFLHFDGVYMDCTVYINGKKAGSHAYGYTPFWLDLTALVHDGTNQLEVCVRFRSPNSRWYSGAGIFRDVELLCLPERFLVPDSIASSTKHLENGWSLSGTVEWKGPSTSDCLTAELTDEKGVTIASASFSADSSPLIPFSFSDLQVTAWSPDSPVCYCLHLHLGAQSLSAVIGFREIAFHADHGFFLNGENIKLHGVCLHHDLGLLGSAFHREAAERQLTKLKKIGVNAIRFSHNPPSEVLLALCDHMGFLVIDEAFDMWEMPKTTYDYARFFDDCWKDDIAAFVRRDRNHPCVVLWSVGNEILDTHLNPNAPRITRLLRDEVRFHDGFRHAGITLASNYMPWAGAQACCDTLSLAGYNYGEKLYQAHHAEHKDWVIYGSETGSVVSSRGIYHFPFSQPVLSDEDLQCSSLGNSTTSWGHQDFSTMLADDLNTPYSMGQFIWAGIDYIGEPTPYHTRSSYFGLFDTAVFPKDLAYRCQAAWTKAPFVHIGVSWDGNPGQLIDIPVCTNQPEIELFLGDVSLGRKAADPSDPHLALPLWQIPYQCQPLRAVAYDAEGRAVASDTREPFGDPVRLCITREDAAPGSLAFLVVTAADEHNVPVDHANDRVYVHLTGPARLLGMDNGDSTDEDGYVVQSKRLFSGKLLIIAEALSDHGEVTVSITSDSLEGDCITLPVNESFSGVSAPPLEYPLPANTGTWIRKILLTAKDSAELSPEHPFVDIAYRTLPQTGGNETPVFRICNAAGIDSPCATVENKGDYVRVTGHGDGHFYLRASVTNGAGHPRVLSHLELSLTGFGSPCLDPYSFVAGGLYDAAEGEITPGNEHGFAFARDGDSMAGFHQLDFGDVGSDEITIPVFALNNDLYHIRLHRENQDAERTKELISVLSYQKPSIWNHYQEETWHLPVVLKGIQHLYFASDQKIHFKGFVFSRQKRTERVLKGADADRVWGDEFHFDGSAIAEIGNNVSVEFHHMDFGTLTNCVLSVKGHTTLKEQPITILIEDSCGHMERSLFTFPGDKEEAEGTISVLPGETKMTLVFLPGSHFTFLSMRFIF